MSSRQRRASRAILGIAWGYAISLAVAAAAMYVAGDRWWPATLLLFGPRWLAAAPLILLIPAAYFARRAVLWPLLLSVGILLGPVLGFTLPLRAHAKSDGARLRVLTCNLSASDAAAERLIALVEELRPDLVALQESRSRSMRWPAGWQVISDGELLIASRHPIVRQASRQGSHPPHTYPRSTMLRCEVQLPTGPLSFSCVHFPSPRNGLTTILDRTTLLAPSRRGTLAGETANRSVVSKAVSEEVTAQGGNAIVAGDFNSPIESAIYRRDWSGYANAFSRAGLGFGWSMWVTVRWITHGVRIDHILMGKDWAPRRAWVARDVGSEHRPMVADLIRTR